MSEHTTDQTTAAEWEFLASLNGTYARDENDRVIGDQDAAVRILKAMNNDRAENVLQSMGDLEKSPAGFHVDHGLPCKYYNTPEGKAHLRRLVTEVLGPPPEGVDLDIGNPLFQQFLRGPENSAKGAIVPHDEYLKALIRVNKDNIVENAVQIKLETGQPLTLEDLQFETDIPLRSVARQMDDNRILVDANSWNVARLKTQSWMSTHMPPHSDIVMPEGYKSQRLDVSGAIIQGRVEDLPEHMRVQLPCAEALVIVEDFTSTLEKAMASAPEGATHIPAEGQHLRTQYKRLRELFEDGLPHLRSKHLMDVQDGKPVMDSDRMVDQFGACEYVTEEPDFTGSIINIGTDHMPKFLKNMQRLRGEVRRHVLNDLKSTQESLRMMQQMDAGILPDAAEPEAA